MATRKAVSKNSQAVRDEDLDRAPLVGFDKQVLVPCAYIESEAGREAAAAMCKQALEVVAEVQKRLALAEIQEFFKGHPQIKTMAWHEGWEGDDEGRSWIASSFALEFMDGSGCDPYEDDFDEEIEGESRGDLRDEAENFAAVLLENYPLIRKSLVGRRFDRKMAKFIGEQAMAKQAAFEIEREVPGVEGQAKAEALRV